MRWMDRLGVGVGSLLGMVCFGCAPSVDNPDNRQDHGTTAQVATSGEREESPGSPGPLPFIAEAKSPFTVIDLLSPGRLEIVDGCLTVAVQGKERATAVFPPGVKPELKGNDMVAVSFGGRTIPLGQQAPIPGGFVDLSSVDLVRPIPSNCPKKLFGL